MLEHSHPDDLVEKAGRLVARYLNGQARACGETSIDHCLRVERRVAVLGVTHLDAECLVRARLIARLHDLIEDGANWDDSAALEALRAEIGGEFGIEILSDVEEITVDQRLAPQAQFDEFRRRVARWSVEICLAKWADIEDNARTRYVYNETYRAQWEAYATDMWRDLIPARLRELGWCGSLPPAHLPLCVMSEPQPA